MQKFFVWYEEFPNGCGNCGAPDHVFDHCPLRNLNPPKIQVTIKKHPSRVNLSNNITRVTPEDEGGDWTPVTTRRQRNYHVGESSRSKNIGQDQAEKGGITVLFKPTESTILLPTGKETLETQASLEKRAGSLEKEVLTSQETTQPRPIGTQPTPENKDNLVAHQSQATADPKQGQGQTNINSIVDFLEEDGNCEEEEFTKEELDAYLAMAEPNIDNEMEAVSEVSFQSLNTNNSVLKLMEGMEMRKEDMSTTGSGKRKGSENEGDTASSSLKKNKTAQE